MERQFNTISVLNYFEVSIKVAYNLHKPRCNNGKNLVPGHTNQCKPSSSSNAAVKERINQWSKVQMPGLVIRFYPRKRNTQKKLAWIMNCAELPRPKYTRRVVNPGKVTAGGGGSKISWGKLGALDSKLTTHFLNEMMGTLLTSSSSSTLLGQVIQFLCYARLTILENSCKWRHSIYYPLGYLC